ncbi:MAG TPA: HAMP domain-containing sensor histidine kinase [Chitinophagales bacterium]|nr:HAMP domain-containing sensor histidine kinase [Chitinophagales bacterium]HNK98839.1 HAMP domain-containing sensor histidine kinase [Chitinophagales bacterium]
MPGQRRSRYWLFFHIVFIYITVSFLWWSYLLHRNNLDNFNDVVAREKFVFTQERGPFLKFEDTANYKRIYDDFKRTELMLYGEGLVFLFLIGLGFWRIRKTFREEIAMTRQQNNFLLSITHELKSPLASLKLSMQTVQKRQLDAEHIRHLSGMALDDIARLEALVENILLASKIESANFQLNRELLDVSSLVTNILAHIAEKHKSQRQFTSDIEKDAYCYGDRLSFSSVVYNLIENAINYSGADGRIHVQLTGDEEHIYLQISDNGIGVPDAEKTKIFNRFYRIGAEETRTTKGTGLGLFIVKHVVELHGGKIEVTDNDPKGTNFKVTIPVGA